MKFKELDCNSFSVRGGEPIVCIDSSGKDGYLTKWKTYYYTGYRKDDSEIWFLRNDLGQENQYSKYRFRKASDLISEDEDVVKLRKENEELKEKLDRLLREHALVLEVIRLEEIIENRLSSIK